MAAQIIAFPGTRARHPSNVPGTPEWDEMARKVGAILDAADAFLARTRGSMRTDFANVTDEQIRLLYMAARADKP